MTSTDSLYISLDNLYLSFECIPHNKRNCQRNSISIFYVYEGEGFLYSSNESQSLSEGDFVLIMPKTKFSLVSQSSEKGSPMRVCSIEINQEFFNGLIKQYNRVIGVHVCKLYNILTNMSPFYAVIHDDAAHNIKHLSWLIAHEYNHFTLGSNEIIQSSLNNLMITITRLYEFQNTDATPLESKNHEIDKIIKYIHSNFGKKITLELLASDMHLSREYLSRYFKRYTGKNISETLLEVRMYHAKEMLITTTHAVADIGLYCGYTSSSNFQKAFKKYTGMSPREFRNINT